MLLHVSSFCMICVFISLHFWTTSRLALYRVFYKRIAPSVHLPLGLNYIFDGPRTIQKAYSKAGSKPFAVPTPTNNHVLISSRNHIDELLNAPSGHLSLHAVAKEMLQPKYTMRGFEWQDKRGIEGTGFVRALRSLLTAHLPQLLPRLKEILGRGLLLEVNKHRRSDGSAYVPISKTIKKLIVQSNTFAFFGEELLEDAEFLEAALQFPQDVIVAAEAVRLAPTFLAGFVAGLATHGHKSSKKMAQALTPIVEDRLKLRDVEQESTHKPIDCMQWIIDTSPRSNPWTVQRLVGEVMAIWFSSVHQLAMATTFILVDLCIYSQYVEPLREELSQNQVKLGNLPRLDSFMKESMRLNSIDAITCRRKALVPFTFSCGYRVEVGDWVSVPQQAMMRDRDMYSNPSIFDGFRFVPKSDNNAPSSNSRLQEEASAITDASPSWLVWGAGKTVCPGRFYAATIMKLMVIEVLQNFDCGLLDPNARRTITWRSSVIPRETILLRFENR